jgi:hypothetical protein
MTYFWGAIVVAGNVICIKQLRQGIGSCGPCDEIDITCGGAEVNVGMAGV